MKCSNCFQELSSNATQCERCGMPVNRATPAGNETQMPGEILQNIEFLAIPTDRLIWLTVITGGFYLLYWNYKNWLAILKFKGELRFKLLRSIKSQFAQARQQGLGFFRFYLFYILIIEVT